MQGVTPETAYFGKIPTHGDFVRRHANGAAARAMDTWIQQGMYLARSRTRSEAPDDGARAYPFYFDPGGSSVLVGVMGPSRDSVGRSYPFVVACEAEPEALGCSDAAQVPVLLGAFFKGAADVVREAVGGRIGPHDLAARTDPLGLSPGGDAAYVRHLQETPATALWERLWGYPDDSRKYLLFKNLLDLLLPLRSGIPSGYRLALRFPLSTEGRTAAFDARFWLELCRGLLCGSVARPTFFWTQPGDAPEGAPFLLLSLRPPPARTFTYLSPAGADGDSLCDLETMGAQNAALAALSIPAQYGELLESEQLSLWAFLQRL